MKVRNRTKGTLLADKAKVADTFFARLRGLLGCKGLKAGEALIIKPCSGIHTFFMRFPIDLIFLDKALKIVKIRVDTPSFRLILPASKGWIVIELPAGRVEQSRTEVGDFLELL